MAVILCLETSTTNCSVAIAVDGEIIALQEDNNNILTQKNYIHLLIKY